MTALISKWLFATRSGKNPPQEAAYVIPGKEVFMLRSLYSAVSGLNIHQTQMDVIGNNIANVNTNGYKSKATNFSDILYQSKQRASGPSEATGSINPIQIGLGGRVAAVDTNITKQGSALTTSAPFNMMINGDAFFVVTDGTNQYYTRDGDFFVDGEINEIGNPEDDEGYLVTSSLGYYVLGWESADGATVNTDGALDRIMLMGPDIEDSPGEPTTYITVTGNVDKMDPSIYTKEGHGVSAGALVPGEEGFESYNINFSITDAGDDDDTTYLMTLTGVTDSTGKSVDFEEQEIELTYSPADGKLTSAETANINVGGVGITVDISRTTNYNTSGTTTFRTSRGDAEGNGEGQEDGKMSGISIQRDGRIYAKYTNGDTRLLAQMATATFMNATGLVNEGDNLYSASNASGDPDIAPVTESGGSISTGVLEASNVDLSDEFTRMITAQRAFQANSRVITTSDTMLSELRNLKST